MRVASLALHVLAPCHVPACRGPFVSSGLWCAVRRYRALRALCGALWYELRVVERTNVSHYERFAASVLSAEMPRWFYLAWSCARLVAIRRRPKPGRTAADTPPRPIAIGEAARGAITSAALQQCWLAPLVDYLAPQ